jgi:glycosyltransferase involved in cell wall biosynthesis
MVLLKMRQKKIDVNSVKPLKLLILCQLFYPELVSTGQTLTELGEELVNLGVDLEVVCAPSTFVDRTTRLPRYMEHNGIRINRVWSTRFSKLNLFGKIINQVTYTFSAFLWLLFDRTSRPIFVLTNPSFAAFLCSFLRFLRGNPYIFVIFDVHPDAAIKLEVIKKNGIVAKSWDLLNKMAFKYASAIVVLGRCMYEIVISERKAGAAAKDRTHIIHIWSDDRLIHKLAPNKNPLIENWNLKGKFVVGYSGNFGRFHDVETIMKAAKILKNYPEIHFLFIGEGYKKLWMIDFARRWNLTNCQFHTYVDREFLCQSHGCFSVGLVSLAKGQEGLSVPSKMYGILAAGKPVIAIMSRNTETAMVLDENDCGVVIKQGDVNSLAEAILNLYKDPEMCETMGTNGREIIDKRYNLREAAKSYLSVIKSVQYA